MTGSAVVTIVGDVIHENGEGAGGMIGLANGEQIEAAAGRSGIGSVVDHQLADEPAAGLMVEVALRIAYGWPEDAGRAVDCGGKVKEGAYIFDAGEWVALGVEDANDGVDRFKHV